MHYYQHHIGDFIRDTSRLPDSHLAAYLRMIWMYYESEQPIPNNPRVIGLKVGADPEVVSVVLEAFFKLDGDVWRHTRCDKEIAEYHEICDRNSANGKRGGRPKKTQSKPKQNPVGFQSVSSGNPVETQTGSQSEPSRNPDETLTSNHKPLTNTKDKSFVLASPQAAQTSPASPVIAIPLIDKTEHPVSQAQLDEWADAYPAVDVLQQLRNMRQWCIANPAKRKTQRGVHAFIVRWLADRQDKPGLPAEQKSAPMESFYERDQRLKAEEMAKWAPGVAKKPLNFSNPFEYIDMEQSNVIAIEGH